MHCKVSEIKSYRNQSPTHPSTNGQEVDVVIGDAKVAIEIKSSEQVRTKHKAGLKAFKEEHPNCRLILVSLDPITRVADDMELIFIIDFLRMLWNGEMF